MNDGGPAFPITAEMVEDGQKIKETQGMTLRDYFAAKAMQGIMSNPSFEFDKMNRERRVSLAYLEADAMIAERSKNND